MSLVLNVILTYFLELGCVRLLHGVSDSHGAREAIRQVYYTDYMGYYTGADAAISGQYHLWACRRSVWSEMALHH